ncbi:hypothetical protein [Flavobacterium suaedae]|uniref:hypothetical protein n=1 Tax=Flavobacterium suaedae TaxID=1767027 RepID=UPI001664073F|nr:hypothetical protein [Flavobacterium suaedae]
MNTILKKINIYKIIRLIIGALLLWQAIEQDSLPLIIFAGLLTIAPLFNVGCTANSSCRIPERKSRRRK